MMSRINNQRVLCAALFGIALAVAGGAHAVPSRGLAAQDLVGLARVGAPVVSPDGQRLVYTLRETDVAANKAHTELYVLDLKSPSAVPQRLTNAPQSSSQPHWSADSTAVYFLSARSGLSQVWRISLKGGEATPVTQVPVDIESYTLSPNEDRLLFSAGVFPECGDLLCTQKRLSDAEKSATHARTFDQLMVRHWDTWADGRRSELFGVSLDAAAKPAGAVVALSMTLDGDVPSKPFGDASEYAFSPDGKAVVYAMRVAGRAEAWSTNFDVYLVPSSGGNPRNLTESNPAWDAEPRFSPDGRTLAYRAMDRAGFEADRFHFVLRNVSNSDTRVLAGNWDRSIDSYRWTRDGRALVAIANEGGEHALFRIDAKSGAVTRLTAAGTGSVEGFDVAADRIVFTRTALNAPADLYAMSLTGAGVKQLTHVNDARLADVKFGEFEAFTFKGALGESVHGYAMKPWNAVAGVRYPVAYLIHGGPQGSFGNSWSYRWNPEVFAGAGYAVVFIDFHGSTGYGQAFTDSISHDWGGKPLEDLQKGLAAAEVHYPWIDGSRACALGASYGGFMINWIAGNWSDRFKCLVNHDGIFDARSMYYSTEELWFEEWEQGGPQYTAPELYERFSPSRLVNSWKTPMLVIHGEQDFRVPLEQGLSTFTALQRRGIDSKLLVFPDENHWVLKPQNSLIWHSTVLDWLETHLTH